MRNVPYCLSHIACEQAPASWWSRVNLPNLPRPPGRLFAGYFKRSRLWCIDHDHEPQFSVSSLLATESNTARRILLSRADGEDGFPTEGGRQAYVMLAYFESYNQLFWLLHVISARVSYKLFSSLIFLQERRYLQLLHFANRADDYFRSCLAITWPQKNRWI